MWWGGVVFYFNFVDQPKCGFIFIESLTCCIFVCIYSRSFSPPPFLNMFYSFLFTFLFISKDISNIILYNHAHNLITNNIFLMAILITGKHMV